MFSLFGNTKEGAAEALSKGDFATAIRRYRKALEKNANDHEMHHDLGVALLETGAAAEAIACFERANAIHDRATHWNSLGRAHLVAGDHAAAMAAFSKARSMDPGDPMPWYNMTVCMREQGKGEVVFDELKSMLARFPDHAGAHYDLGCHYEDRGEKDKALGEFERAVTINPHHVHRRLNLIRVLCELQRFPDALPHLEFLAAGGIKVEVAANDGRVRITINGKPFYEGVYTAS
jgi:tetratricopeptide (TPR) repeat protein